MDKISGQLQTLDFWRVVEACIHRCVWLLWSGVAVSKHGAWPQHGGQCDTLHWFTPHFLSSGYIILQKTWSQTGIYTFRSRNFLNWCALTATTLQHVLVIAFWELHRLHQTAASSCYTPTTVYGHGWCGRREALAARTLRYHIVSKSPVCLKSNYKCSNSINWYVYHMIRTNMLMQYI